MMVGVCPVKGRFQKVQVLVVEAVLMVLSSLLCRRDYNVLDKGGGCGGCGGCGDGGGC